MKVNYVCSKCGYQHNDRDFVEYHENLCGKVEGSIPAIEYASFFNINEDIIYESIFSKGYYQGTIKKIEVFLSFNDKLNKFVLSSEKYTLNEQNSCGYIENYSNSDFSFVHGLFRTKQEFMNYKCKNIRKTERLSIINNKFLNPNTTYYIRFNNTIRQAVITGVRLLVTIEKTVIIYRVAMYNPENHRTKVGVNYSYYEIYDITDVLDDELKLTPEDFFK